MVCASAGRGPEALPEHIALGCVTIGRMDRSHFGRVSSQNLVATWRETATVIGGIIGGSDVCPSVALGVPAPPFNGAILMEPVADRAGLLEEIAGFMAHAAVPYLVWVREGLDDEFPEACLRAGLTDVGGPPVMAMASLAPGPPPPAELSIEQANGPEDITDFVNVFSEGFGVPRVMAERVFTRVVLTAGVFGAVLGRVDGQAVTAASVTVSGTTAGIYNVATLAKHRGKGYGAAMTWAAMDVGRSRGCDHAILQASEMGLSVYEKMGFEIVGRYRHFAGPPAG